MLRAGYVETFEGGRGPLEAARCELRTGAGGIRIDDFVGCVRLPPGVGFDPGGIGKGLAADLVAHELLDLGAAGACVNVGGDVRVIGDPGEGDAWRIAIDDPRVPGARLARAAPVRRRGGDELAASAPMGASRRGGPTSPHRSRDRYERIDAADRGHRRRLRGLARRVLDEGSDRRRAARAGARRNNWAQPRSRLAEDGSWTTPTWARFAEGPAEVAAMSSQIWWYTAPRRRGRRLGPAECERRLGAVPLDPLPAPAVSRPRGRSTCTGSSGA